MLIFFQRFRLRVRPLRMAAGDLTVKWFHSVQMRVNQAHPKISIALEETKLASASSGRLHAPLMVFSSNIRLVSRVELI